MKTPSKKILITLFITAFIILLPGFSESQWLNLNTGISGDLNSVHFINLQTGYAAGTNGVVIKTTNSGQNWSILNTGTGSELRSVYFLNSSNGIVCGNNGLILRTSNGGTNWTSINSGTADHLLGLSFYDELKGVCSGNTGTLLYTSNGGLNWSTGSPTGFLVTFYSVYMVNPATAYAAGVNTIFSPLVAKTSDGGANWSYFSFMLNNNEGTLRDIHFFDTENGLAVSNLWNGPGGISRTTNGGLNWTSELFPDALFGIDFSGSSTGYCAGYNGIILKTTNGGYNWIQQPSNTNAFLKSIDFIDPVNGFTAGTGGTVLKTTNGGITNVNINSNYIPDNFILYQNYPNPFNPLTNIDFDIPVSGNVSLKVYDVSGKEAAEIFNEFKTAGFYSVKFNAANLSSGLYFYRLSSGNFTSTKKMILLK